MKDRLWLALALFSFAACDCGDGTLDQLEAAISLAPDPLVFDTIPRGTRAIRVLTVANPGQLPLHVSAAMIESGEGFDLGETTFVVEPGGAHELPIGFTAGATAAVEGSVVLDSNAADTPRARAGLRASRRTGPVLAVCVESADLALPLACDVPASINFGAVAIGQVREAVLSLRSEGTDPLSVSAIFSGHPAFELDADAVPAVLAPGERLDLPVRFTAAVTEGVQALITVSSNDVNAAETEVALSGSGVDLALCAEPPLLDFGEVLVGSSLELPVELTACGAAPIEVTAAEIFLGGPELSLPSPITTPITLAPQAGVQFELKVRYAPVDEGEDRGRLRISTPNGTSIVQLTGRSSACRLVATPGSLHFDWETAAADVTRTLLLQNTGAQPCTVDRVEIVNGGELGFTFGSRALITELPELPRVLGPGEALTASVNFSPRRLTTPMVAGRIEVAVLERSDLVEVDLSATVVAGGRCELTASPSSLTFGLVGAGQQRLLGVRLLNGTLDSVAPCHLAGVTFTDDAGGAFRFLDTPPELVWGEVFVYVELTPPAPGVYRGELSIVTADTPAQTLTIPLSGGSGTPALCVSPRELPFGATTTTSTRSFELSACAGDSVTIEALEWTQPDPELSLRAPPALPLTLAPGESRTVLVEYSPADQAGDTGVVTVRSSDPLAPELTVRATGGPELAPIEAGRYLFFWQITGSATSDIIRAPLQGALTPSPYFGARTGQRCGGCHQLSPDGKYVAVSTLDPLGFASLSILEAESGAVAGGPGTLLDGLSNELFVSWNPNVNTVPAYQYAFAIAGDVHRASLFGGYEGPLSGASDPGLHETMPAWGPDGQIAFVRWDEGPGGSYSLPGPTSMYLVDETGGAPTALAGVSANGFGNYYPRYSPDGRWIAFTVSESAFGAISAPDAQLRLVRADGSGIVDPLSALNEGASSFPIWSADGTFLSFSSNRPGSVGSWDLYLAPIDPLSGQTGAVVPMSAANTPDFEHAAQWQP